MDISFKDEEIKDGMLAEFSKIHSGALEVFLVLVAYASEKTKMARIAISAIMKKTGFSLTKVVKALNRLKEVDFIEAPFEGQQGRKQIYKLKVLMDGQGDSADEDKENQKHINRHRKNQKKICVYFLLNKNQNTVKIGSSYNPRKRFITLQRDSLDKLEFLDYIQVGEKGRKREKELHKVFEDFRIKGEWFEYNKTVEIAIKSLILEDKKNFNE